MTIFYKFVPEDPITSLEHNGCPPAQHSCSSIITHSGSTAFVEGQQRTDLPLFVSVLDITKCNLNGNIEFWEQKHRGVERQSTARIFQKDEDWSAGSWQESHRTPRRWRKSPIVLRHWNSIGTTMGI